VGNPPNANVVIQVDGAPAHTIIAFCYILIIIYALTLAPVAWVYAAEVWSLETRATGMSLAAVANWLFNWALGLFVPPAMRNITYKLFIIFGVLCFAAAVQAFFTYPETCGKTLVRPHFLILFPFPSVFFPGSKSVHKTVLIPLHTTGRNRAPIQQRWSFAMEDEAWWKQTGGRD